MINQLRTNITLKIVAGIVTVFALFATVQPVAAQSTDELQSIINDLLAQIAELQAQIGVDETSNLSIGDRVEVTDRLTVRLRPAGLRIGAAFKGETGEIIGGPRVADGNTWWRIAYDRGQTGWSAEPWLQAVFVEDKDITLTLNDVDAELSQGGRDQVLAEIDADIQGYDAIILTDLSLQITTPTSSVSDILENVTVWVEGDKSSESNIFVSSSSVRVNLNNIDAEIIDGEGLVLGASIRERVPSQILNQPLTLELVSARYLIPELGTDAVEVSLNGDEAEFTIVAKTIDELQISLSANNPDSASIIVDDEELTEGVTILIGEMEAQETDIELETMVIRVSTPGASTTRIVDGVYVEIDNDKFYAEPVQFASAASIDAGNSALITSLGEEVWYLFNIDGDVYLEAGEDTEFEVMVDIEASSGGVRYDLGQTIQARVSGTELRFWEAEGDDYVTSQQIVGTAAGAVHKLVTQGLVFDLTDTGVRATGEDDEVGQFELEFDITAVETDIYIPNTISNDIADTESGFSFNFYRDGLPEVSGWYWTAAVDSTADEDDEQFVVEEGNTESFTLTVTGSPLQTGMYRVALSAVRYYTDGAKQADLITYGLGNTNRTNYLTVQGSRGGGGGIKATEAEARIIFTQAEAKPNSSAQTAPQLQLPNGEVVASGEWFNLTENGQFIDDGVPVLSIPGGSAFPGLNVSRLDGDLNIALMGDNADRGWERVAGTIEFRAAQVVDVNRYMFSASTDSAKRTSLTSVEFKLQADGGRDRFVISLEPDRKVRGVTTVQTQAFEQLQSIVKRLQTIQANAQ